MNTQQQQPIIVDSKAALDNYEKVKQVLFKTNYPSPTVIAYGFLIVIVISIALYYVFMRPNISGIWIDIANKKIYDIRHNKYTDRLIINDQSTYLIDRTLYYDGVCGILIGDTIQFVGGNRWDRTRQYD